MSQRIPYESAEQVVGDRIGWSIAMLHALIQRARRQGWLEGSLIEDAPDPFQLLQAIEERCRLSCVDPRVLPMPWLSARLRLEACEAEALWLLACIELSPAVARLTESFGTAAGITLQILRELVPATELQIATLQRFGLVELQTSPDVPHQSRRIRIGDRVLTLLRGELDLDLELHGIATFHAAGDPDGSATDLAHSLIVAVGPEGSGRTNALVAVATPHGTLRIQAAKLARDPAIARRQLRAAVREACLFDVVPLVQELDDEPTRSIVEESFAHYQGCVLVTSRTGMTWRDRPVVRRDMARPTGEQRLECWTQELGDRATPELVSQVASRYALWPRSIRESVRNALATGKHLDADVIQAGVSAHLGESLATLATRVDWKQSWADLVLPVEQFEQLLELVARARHRDQVLETWGFSDKVGKGNGIAALLSGPPGTGKTMAAGLLAKELGLDLYQVDLSKVVSKYIGETEKQLAALFDAAETGQAIVLFDEADSLFAKRSEVKSSNDRYANLEVNYLLQRLESFTGIVLLTTNHERSIDEAFRRRLSLHVRFPAPDESHRVQLWKALMPDRAAVADDLDFGRLASAYDMSGGYIKNAVLRAAYLAAHEKRVISMDHLWRAARSESEAMGKLVAP
jgi:hypothetical protein